MKNRLLALESAVRMRIEAIKEDQDETHKREDEYREDLEDEEDGGAQRTLSLKEVGEQLRLLEASHASAEALATQIKRNLTMQKIKDVKARDDSTAVAGFINTVADPKIEQDISNVTADKRSFAGAGVIMGLNFQDLRPFEPDKWSK